MPRILSRAFSCALLACAIVSTTALADEPEPAPAPRPRIPAAFTTETLKTLPLRGIGPCITPGRVGDIAVDPKNRSIWYVAMASGGVWKTINRGITWAPIFDDHGVYSMGCVTVDPRNSDVVWLGTGENQSQRSVGYGNGLYKSTDAGKSWQNVGLKQSEHIAKVLIDPRDSKVVYVASQGPLWSPGGDRGLFKTTDGGKSWKAVLEIDEHTGITDVCLDPRDPDVLYAASYQRRRNVGVLVGGGPGSGIHKSTDGGKSWTRLVKGLPEVDLGRIALAISPQKPDVLYAHIQRAGGKESGGFFRTEDGGKEWTKRGTVNVQDGQYYGEIFADPHKFDSVWVMDMIVRKTEDGGKTFRSMNWATHVDHHALVFDPNDPDHLISGNDGGLYETFDGGKTFRHFDTLSSTQYYRITVDNSEPFYNVYGGAQDNGTMGGPVRSRNRVGVRTSDWGKIGGADGMQPRVDPTDPDTVYTSSQNGSLVRLDRQTGRSAFISPSRGGKGGGGEGGKGGGVRFNWDTPYLISPHAHKRLYFAGSKLFKSEDRGDSWKAISPDLTRQLDPLKIEVMGKLWGADAVSRNTFTTALSMSTALDESPIKAGLLYVGTDDGLIQVSENDGANWQKLEKFPGVPEGTWVSDLFASRHDDRTVYASFNNWQRGDFKPYLLRSRDRGHSWESIAGNLPNGHGVWSVVEDHVNRNLLFAGTEFGLSVSIDGGKDWVAVPGAPPIPFRDLEVQRREGDLVCGTFGRGVYVLDDYAPLRSLTPEVRLRDATLCPVRKTLGFVELPFAARGGEFSAPNPPAGALITYLLRQDLKGRVALKVSDAAGKTMREITGTTSAGLHRTAWDLRVGGGGGGGGGGPRGGGSLAPPGKYTVTLTHTVGGATTILGKPQTFEVVPLKAAAVAVQP